MKPLWSMIWRGMLLWALIFFWSMAMFRFHETNRPLFETLILLGEVFFTVALAVQYLRNVRGNLLRTSLLTGLIWAVINVGLDLPLFSWGPMKRPLLAYMQDIGLAYLAIPMITTGMGWLAELRTRTGPCEAGQLPGGG